MLNLNEITKLEKKIKSNKLLIKKKKKSIPYFLTIIILVYLVIFNLRDKLEFSNYFDNQLHFIKILTYIFIGIIIAYFLFLFFRISIISKHVKQQNISLFKLSKLDEKDV